MNDGPVGEPGLAAAPVRRAAVVNLGCKVNQAEIEAAARVLRASGTKLVDDRQAADLVLVNTCTVTSVADQKSRQAVRRARRTSPDAVVVVTGCSAQIDPGAIRAADPEARIVGNEGKEALLAELRRLGALDVDDAAARIRSGTGARTSGPLPTLSGVELAPAEPAPTEAMTRDGWAGSARLDGITDDRTAADRTRAFIKVQDGCSFHCTYCVIPRARGPERSLPPAIVLADIRRALRAGHREIVLTGINIGTYDGGWSERGPRGSHVRAALSLPGLVRLILSETDVERIRLSSIEPQHVDDELLATWTGPGAGRCLPHMHLPLQSGDDGVLRRMGRRYDARGYRQVVERVRAAMPGVAVHADVIVGFPTEDDAAFERSVDLIGDLRLDGLHVFRYSSRPGTPATRMLGQVPERIRGERAGRLLELAALARARRARERIGGEALVLFEERLPDGRWLGHAEDHVPVAALPPQGGSLENAIGRVVLDGVDPVRRDVATGGVVALVPAPTVRAGSMRTLAVLDLEGGLAHAG